ncbi:MAG TPA: diguanylate cyclase [Sandaracinaceae bacterium LLY-WYZ-13_1]|nr:diguanylate cyclase [Sandaracinaceae bacterium LLY-WYZ-13_1]
MRVLVADDSPVSRKVLQRMLVSWGYDVVPCENGAQAWDALSGDDAPELAILDWVMPEMDGIEVCRRLRAGEEGSHAFVYLLTARTSTEDMLAGLEAGADDYLTKPVNAAELRIRLRNGRRLVQLHRELVAAREALRTQAMIDPLTEVWNRRAFMELAAKELSRSRRSGRPLGLLMIDLDHFKRVNDTYGHPAGDAVLAEAAARIRAALREGDQVARFGGEEMVVLLPDCGPSGAFVAADRVRRELARTPVDFEGQAIRVTASLGVAATHGCGESLDGLLARADQALYEAKRAGRDRTVVAAPADLAKTAS